MRHLIKNSKCFITFLSIHFTASAFCQFKSEFKPDPINISGFFRKEEHLKKTNLGVEIIASILPKARITKEEGNYKLRSHLQSSYDLGINYSHYINKNLNISTGLHFIVGKRNFFANIPSEDINNWDGRNIIENKELWGSFRIPLLIEKELNCKKANGISIKIGFNFRYSGLMSDESFGVTIIDSNNQFTDIFNAELSGRNNGKPWVTFLAGASKSIVLNNRNVLSVGLQTDVSTTFFFKGNYEFTIPNQPTSKGTYKINGSSLGLSVQYIFTGTNKLIVKSKKIITIPDTLISSKQLKGKFLMDQYIFKGNHIQFNFALLSTFKASLKNHSGTYPVSTNAAPGFLLSLKYQKNFNNEYSLLSGPEAMLPGRNFITSFSKNDFFPPLVSNYSTKGNSLIQDLILSLPVLIEKRWLYSKTKFLFADAGVRLNFSLGADLDVYSITLLNTANGVYQVGGVNVYANNDAKPWISFPANAGHAWLLRNNNLLQLAIYSNISFTKYVNGRYQIDIPGRPPTEGKYSSTGSFIGLSFNYVFTNANNRIRKAYEELVSYKK